MPSYTRVGRCTPLARDGRGEERGGRLYPIIKIRGSVAFGETPRKPISVSPSAPLAAARPFPRQLSSPFLPARPRAHRPRILRDPRSTGATERRQGRRPVRFSSLFATSSTVKRMTLFRKLAAPFGLPLLFQFPVAFLSTDRRRSIRPRSPSRLFHAMAPGKVCCLRRNDTQILEGTVLLKKRTPRRDDPFRTRSTAGSEEYWCTVGAGSNFGVGTLGRLKRTFREPGPRRNGGRCHFHLVDRVEKAKIRGKVSASENAGLETAPRISAHPLPISSRSPAMATLTFRFSVVSEVPWWPSERRVTRLSRTSIVE